MDFVKRNMFFILCAVGAIAGIALGVTGLQAMPRVVAAMKDEEDRLTKLVRQASKVLCVLVEKGVMSQAELNEATRPPDG